MAASCCTGLHSVVCFNIDIHRETPCLTANAGRELFASLGVWSGAGNIARPVLKIKLYKTPPGHRRSADSGVPGFFTILTPGKLRAFQPIKAGRNVEPSHIVSWTHGLLCGLQSPFPTQDPSIMPFLTAGRSQAVSGLSF